MFHAADALGPLQRWRDLLAQAPRLATMVGGITTAVEGARPAAAGRARLQAVKRAWDPDNVFHLNQDITP